MEQLNLNLIPGNTLPVCHASQYDVGRIIRFNLFEGSTVYTLAETETAEVHIRKNDNTVVTAALTVAASQTYVDVVTTEQMTACAGSNLGEIQITSGGNIIGSLNFIMEVEADPMDEGIPNSKTQIHNLQAQVDDAVSTSILAENIADMKDNINLLYTELVLGKFLYYSNGVEAENATWNYFRFIPVKAGLAYYTNLMLAWVCYYDSNKNYLSGEQIYQTYAFTPPAGAEYIQISYDTTKALRYNTTIPELFSKYDFIPVDVAPALKNLNLNIQIQMENLRQFITHGKNLFNKYRATNGFFLSWNTGYTVGENGSFATCFDYIECEPSEGYVVNNNNTIICEYDKEKNFLAAHNLTGGSVYTFTTNANAKYMRVGCGSNIVNTFQLEKGSTASAYEPFKYKFTTETADTYKIIVVDANGTGDYTTITAAVNDAKDGDIIYIKNGEYNEAVDCRTKFLNFKGESKNKVIWKHPNGDYQLPPLEIAKGTVENLTFLATAQSQQPGAIGKAYCVHIDFNESKDEYLAFNNVKFINEDYQTIGIGLRENFTLEFNNCEFICQANNNAFYCHDATVQATDQNVILRNCCFITAGIAFAIHLQSQEVSGSTAFVTFQRCIVVNESANNIIKMTLFNPSIGGGGYLDSTDWSIKKESLLNSDALLNY